METLTVEKLYSRPVSLDGGESFDFTPISIDEFPPRVYAALEKKHTDLRNYYFRPTRSIEEEKWTRTLMTSDGRLSTYIAAAIIPQPDVRLEMTYFFDVYKNGIAGEGRVLRGLNGPIAGTEHPMAVWVHNDPQLKHNNLGERRLALMHAYAKQYYGSSLQSDYEMHEAGFKLWHNLVLAGRAKEIEGLEDEYGRNRFEFLK
jgi:hypothetical protein